MTSIFDTDLHDYNKTENHAQQAIDASWRAPSDKLIQNYKRMNSTTLMKKLMPV
jgi:hypothetical protein